MKIYVLRIIGVAEDSGVDWDALPDGFSPYNDPVGRVVVAENEQDARTIAAAPAFPGSPVPWWLDPDHSTCVEIVAEGPARIVMSDTPTG